MVFLVFSCFSVGCWLLGPSPLVGLTPLRHRVFAMYLLPPCCLARLPPPLRFGCVSAVFLPLLCLCSAFALSGPAGRRRPRNRRRPVLSVFVLSRSRSLPLVLSLVLSFSCSLAPPFSLACPPSHPLALSPFWLLALLFLPGLYPADIAQESAAVSVTRPGLEPGISGSGGRRLIH